MKNIIISGAKGKGKTTIAAAIASTHKRPWITTISEFRKTIQKQCADYIPAFHDILVIEECSIFDIANLDKGIRDIVSPYDSKTYALRTIPIVYTTVDEVAGVSPLDFKLIIL